MKSRQWLQAVLLVCLAGCSALEPARELQVGQTESEVTQRMGLPNARHAMPGGLTRLEFARGPAGRTTWMVDLDSSGHVVAFDQVLSEATFQQVVSDMSREELMRLIGRPANRQGEWQNRETWSWRYPTNDCLWFRVTLSAEGRTLGGGGYMPDPACDHNDRSGD
jgi:hypothetical protein